MENHKLNQLTTQVKICGLSDAHSIEVAIEGGVSHVGFIFFKKSPRNVSPERAGELAALVRGKAKVVAVSVNADDAFLDEIVAKLRPDYLQLHGSETPERIGQLKKRYGLKIIKALAIRQASDFDQAEQYIGVADQLLFDAKPPVGSELPGGNGVSFDWNLFANWQDKHFAKSNGDPSPAGLDNHPDSASLPMLSGGINLDNILAALSSSNARALDISSGVEKAPGVKDPALISALLKLVHDHDKLSAGVADNERKKSERNWCEQTS